MRPGGADQQVTEFLFTLKLTGRVDRNILITEIYITGRDRKVFRREGIVDILLRDAELRHFLAAHFDIDHLFLGAIQDNPLDILGAEQLPLQELGVFVDLLATVSVTGDGNIHTVSITEIIIDQRRSGAGRQRPLVITDLAPQLIKHLRHLLLWRGALEVNLDR